MTEKEILAMIEESDLIDSNREENDGNLYEEYVYKNKDGFFILSYCNSHFQPVFNPKKGWIQGVYEPIYVEKTQEVAVRNVYLNKEDGNEVFSSYDSPPTAQNS